MPKFETVALTDKSIIRLQNKLPLKLQDLGSFTLPISIINSCSINVLCDKAASRNLMPYSIYSKLRLNKVKSISITLQLADRTISCPRGKVEDAFIKAGNLIFLVDIIVLDIEEYWDIPVILGRSFLVTSRTLIDMEKGKLILKVDVKEEIFNIYTTFEQPSKIKDYCRIDEKEPLDQWESSNRRELDGPLGREKKMTISKFEEQKKSNKWKLYEVKE